MRDWLLATLLAAASLSSVGCAGDRPAGTPRPTGTGGAPGPTGAGGAAGTAGSGDYVPDVPVAYDGRYLDGSFEEIPGFGWDTCYTRTPATLSLPETGASHGSRFVRFDTAGAAGPWSPTNPSASLLYLWFTTAPSATAEMGIYFDAKTFDAAGAVPSGLLQLYGTDKLCEQESALAELELGRLQLSSDWATRCVTVTGPGAHAAIGLALSGGSHQIGIDALRLGPPCHSSR